VRSLKLAALWDVVPCSLVDTDRHFTSHMMEAVSISKTSGNVYQTARRKIPQDGHLNTYRQENLKKPHQDKYCGSLPAYYEEGEINYVRVKEYRPCG
jgi:hypothetical protein